VPFAAAEMQRIFEGTSTSAAVDLKASQTRASQDAVSHPFGQFGDAS
jgi:hypothetical protein